MKTEKLTYVSTEKNKGLEPIFINNLAIGYEPEVHGIDALEASYSLPLGAIKRLISSYYDEIKECNEENVYLGTSSSMGSRKRAYCSRMIADIRKQLDKHGLNGKKVDDEVFNQSFKKDFEEMERFYKNHGDKVLYFFKPCKDQLCCRYTKNLFHKVRTIVKIALELLRILRGWVPLKEPHIT